MAMDGRGGGVDRRQGAGRYEQVRARGDVHGGHGGSEVDGGVVGGSV